MNIKTISLIIILLIVAFWAVWTGPKIRRDFSTSDLLIPIELLPATLEISPAGVKSVGRTGFGNSNDSYISFKTTTDKFTISEHYVYQFNNHNKAQSWYNQQFPSEFNDNSIAVSGPWTKPDNWIFQSQIALESHVACAINNIAGEKLVCEYMAQYAEFVAIFWSIIRSDTITMEQFEDIVESIDEIMVTNLSE